MAAHLQGSSRESRHLWVGGLPDGISEVGIKEYFSKFGKIEGVKILPQKYPNIGVAAFIDFYDVKSAVEAQETKHKLGGNELRTNFKAKTTEKFDVSKKTMGNMPEKPSKDQPRRSSSSSSSESDTDDASSSSSTSSDQNTNCKAQEKRFSDMNTVFLKVTGLANRPERILQDGLYYEFCRYSPQAVVKMYGEAPERRSAIVKYNCVESCREAFTHSQGMVLFGSKLKLVPLNIDEFPSGGRDLQLDSHARHSPFADIDPQATRSLFVGNIPKNISIYELRDMFQRFGNVLDVEIKKMGGNATYGFVLYYDLLHAVHAKQCMDGQSVKGNNIRVGFGKGTPSKTLWIDGLDPHTTDSQLERQIVKYGKVVRLGIDHPRCCAMVQYDNADSAKDALNSLKGSFIGNSKSLMTDFANRDARAAFFSCVGDREVSGPSRSYPGPSGGIIGRRGGMVSPRGGIPMIGIGRAGYTLASPPMDYYFSPYLEESVDFYGRQRPPVHLDRGMRRYGPQVPGEFSRSMDYEEELRAFSRKREWEREREKHVRSQNTSPSGSENEKSEGSDSLEKKNKKDRLIKSGKDKVKCSLSDESDGETNSNSEESCESARQKMTKRARKHREGKKRTEPRSLVNKSCSDNNGDASSRDKSKQQRTMLIQETLASPTHKESGECIEVHKEDKCDEKFVLSNVNPHVAEDINVRVHSSEGTEASEEVPKNIVANKATVVPKQMIDSSTKVQPSMLESPQSPVIVKKAIQRSKVESDLSSDEEFDDGVDSSVDIHKRTLVADKECGASGPRTPEPMYQDEQCHKEKQDLSKKPRPVPRQYKMEENVEVQKQGLTESQERTLPLRGVKRYHPASRSPSPHSHRRRRYHSPTSEHVTDKRLCDRGRPPSPDVHIPRRLSRSPPGYCASPTYRRYSTSPHSPRTRSPIPQARSRDRGPSRHLHESPSFDGIRGRYSRRGSPPHRRYPYSPSSPPRHRSPPGRRYGKRRSPSLSSPRQSPGRFVRREKSPVLESCRISPRPSADNTHPASKRHGKRPKFSRTPSPDQRYSKPGSAISPDAKHQDDHSPKSPALSLHSVPPLPTSKDEEASDKAARNMSKQMVDRESDTPCLKLADKVLDDESLKIQCIQSESDPKPLPETEPQPLNNLLDLLRRYPVMWQGHLTLKNDLAAVQLHFLSGNAEIAKMSLPPGSNHVTPTLRIAQRMRLEKSQLEGVERRIQNDVEHCLLLALPCGRDPDDVQTQTHTLKNSLISYLLQKQAAGIINVQGSIGSNGYVLHIFPPCPFSQSHLLRVAPDLSRASDNCHLMVIAAAL